MVWYGNMSDRKKYIKKWICISSSKSATKYVIRSLELKTETYIDLVLSGSEITMLNYFFSVQHENLKNRRKNHWKNCKEYVSYRWERNSCYGTKPYILGTEAILQLVRSLQCMNHNGYYEQQFFDDLNLLPHKKGFSPVAILKNCM